MCFSSEARVVCSSDWGRLGGRVLIIWMLWSQWSKDNFKYAASDIKHPAYLHQALQDYFQEKTVLLWTINDIYIYIYVSFFPTFPFLTTSLMSQQVQSDNERQRTPQVITLLIQKAPSVTFHSHLRGLSHRRWALISRPGKGKWSPFGKVGCCSPHPICWVWDADFICWRRSSG